MTKFEEIGASFQRDAVSPASAERSFALTCTKCCAFGMQIDCERCEVSRAHDEVMEAFQFSQPLFV